MRKNLRMLVMCPVIAAMFLSTSVSAQLTASATRQVAIADSQRSLKDFLSSLEKTFNVYFTFESSVVKGKKVVFEGPISSSLEETLQQTLTPLELRYEKVSDTYYTILRTPEAEQREILSQDSVFNGQQTITFEASSVATHRVSGTVIDENGVSMPGVNVLEKGTTNGTVTDTDGKFTIEVQSESSVLVISFVGYENKEEVVGPRSEISIQLSPDVTSLSEVVVIGYSTQEKKNVTAAVSTVEPKDLTSRPVTNMYQALQGLAPNLTIQQNNAEPGSVPVLNIRGVGSFTDNSPLIIIDGINVGPLGLSYLNPNDVETVTVLKDAASSAIYGSQAANGVIYITTKKGRKDDKMSIEYNGMFGWQSPTTTPKAVEGWEFMTLKNEAQVNSGAPPEFTPQQIAAQREQGSYPWAYDEMVNNVVPQHNQNLSITGGSKSTSYLISGGYMNQQSMFNGPYVPEDKDFYYKRYNLRSNISTQVNKYIRTDLNLAYTLGINRTHPFSTGFLIRDAMRTPRIYPIQNEDGSFVVPPATSNSVFASLSQGGFKKTLSNNMLGVLNVVITPIEHLTINLNASANYSIYNEESQVRKFTYAPQYSTAAPPQFNQQRKSSWTDLSKTMFATVEYGRTFNKHEAKILVGYRSDFLNNYSFVSAYRASGVVLDDNSIISGDFERDVNGNPKVDIGTYTGFSNPELKTVNSVFGRLNYSYDGKYLAEFTWRYDGATILAPKNRWFFFPALSLGWRLTDENFLSSFREDVGDVKLRYSIGQVGNSNIGGFNYISRVNFGPGTYSFNNTPVQGAQFTAVNPELEWERSTMSNYGVDVNVLKGNLSVSFDYFDKMTKGIYFKPAVPGTLGQESPLQNFAEVRAVGWELSANYRATTGAFKHSVSVNVSDNTNKVIKIGQEQISGTDFSFIIKEGFPISSYYLYKSNGFYQNLDDLENAPSVPFAQNQKVNPGDIRYVDKNTDGVIDGNDRYILGSPFPRYTYGFSYNVGWKNFDLSMFWQGVGKRVQYLRGDVVEAFHNNEEHAFVQHKDRWTPANPNASYPRLTSSTSSNTNNVAFSDFWLFDTSYLRLKNLQVGYSIPQSVLGRAGIQYLRIYFSAQNLLTFAPKRFRALGMDPEFTQFDNKLFNASYDPIAGRNYPNSKVLAVGLDLKF